jgi:hypothetical protein
LNTPTLTNASNHSFKSPENVFVNCLSGRRLLTVIPVSVFFPWYNFQDVPKSDAIVAFGPAPQPMGSWPPVYSSQSINSCAREDVESPFVSEVMKSNAMFPLYAVEFVRVQSYVAGILLIAESLVSRFWVRPTKV